MPNEALRSFFGKREEGASSAREAFERAVSAAAGRFDPIGIQEALLEALAKTELARDPKRLAKYAAETLHLLTDHEFNPTATVEQFPGIPGINRLRDFLGTFEKAKGADASVDALKQGLRALDLVS